MKLKVGLFGVFIVSLCGTCLAATIGGPADTKTPEGPGILNMDAQRLGAVKATGLVEFMLDKDIDTDLASATKAEMEGNTYMARISYDLWDKVEPYVLVGGAKIKGEFTQPDASIVNRKVKWEGKSDTIWGVGGKVLAWETEDGNVKITVDGNYRQTEPKIDSARVDGVYVHNEATAKSLEYEDWQVGALIGQRFDLIGDCTANLYAGARYSDSELTIKFTNAGGDQTAYNGSGENDHKVGVIVGVDVLALKWLSLNVEGQFVDETAISTGFTLRF